MGAFHNSIALFSWEELGARPHRATGATFDGSEDCEGGRKPEIDSTEKRNGKGLWTKQPFKPARYEAPFRSSIKSRALHLLFIWIRPQPPKNRGWSSMPCLISMHLNMRMWVVGFILWLSMPLSAMKKH